MGIKKQNTSNDPKIRTTLLLSQEIRDGMKIVKEVERVLPSHQMELAITQYLAKYQSLLKKHGITL